MNFKQISSLIAGPAGFIVLIFFFLPWITVSCSGQELIEASGLDLAQGVDDNDVQVDLADFGMDESAFEDLEIEGGGELTFEDDVFNEPMISVGDTGTEGAGFLEDGDAKLYFLPLIGLIALALVAGVYFEPRLLNMYTAIGGYMLPAGIGLIVMLVKYIEISNDMDDLAAQAAADGSLNLITSQYQFGWWMTVLALLSLFAAGVVAFLFADESAPARVAIADTEQELMQKARELIQAKQYNEARNLLKMMKNPTAQAWLAKLNEIDPFGEV